MQFSTLSAWLAYIATLHTFEMALGLDRVIAVAEKRKLLTPKCPVILVGGTNGKGSTVACLEGVYRAAHYRTGVFTSPYLFRYNEQIRVDGREVTDEVLCAAFTNIEAARGNIALTPFEFGTLAALDIFNAYPLDILILEVGLGGRLDAVNILDADVSVITSIGLDHVEWLGLTREVIALEKAGIFRDHKPAVCGDPSPPQSLLNYVSPKRIPLYCQGQDFCYYDYLHCWSFSFQDTLYENLPNNELATQNRATALMAIMLLQNRLPIERTDIDKGLSGLSLPGRIQIVNGPIVKIFDVSHNPHAINLLAQRVRAMPCKGKTYAVFSMLADKDIVNSIKIIHDVIDVWCTAPLAFKRAATKEKLQRAFQQAAIHNIYYFSTIREAYASVEKIAEPEDRIIIFGSFHTVTETLQQ